MSRTDKDRPVYIRAFDPFSREFYNTISHDAWAHAHGECDAGTEHGAENRFWSARCTPEMRFYRGSYTSMRARDGRKTWHRKHRASARGFLRELVIAANGGHVEEAEDLIDNRQTHRFAEYGGGYWD